MFDKWMQYSYTAQKHQRHRLLKTIFGFFIVYAVYNCLVTFFFSVWMMDNQTMQPGLEPGDRLVFTSFALPGKEEQSFLFKRGSVVLVDMGRERSQKIPLQLADGMVRFFTFQQISIFTGRGQYYAKRVIALPGDEITMTGFVFRVKPANGSYSLTEFELAEKPYQPAIPQIPALWDESIPFSGSMDSIILGPDECFVVSDDRSNTNDSRTWGPVPCNLVTSRAVLRIWPLNKIELF